jgi:chaperonin GroES
MQGDKLASGYRGPVTFRVPGEYVDTTTIDDFHQMPEGEFRAKYLVTGEEYADLATEKDAETAVKKLSSLVKFNRTVAAEEAPVSVVDKRQFTAAGEPKPKKKLEKMPRPIGDRVLLRREEEAAYSEGGLYIEGIANVKPSKCQILSLSERPSNEFATAALAALKVDEWVLIAHNTGDEVTLDDDSKAVIVYVYDILLAS